MGGELKEYEVEVDGNRTTMQLNEHDAKRMGLLGEDPDSGEGGVQQESLVTSAKARGTSNKARTSTENK